jgi:hypothetical protein
MWTALIIPPAFNPYTVISFAAMFISCLAFVATQIAHRRKGDGDYVTRLEARLVRMEDVMKENRLRIEALQDENIALLRKIALNGGSRQIDKE